MESPSNNSGPSPAAIVAVCVVFCFTLTAAVVVFALSPEGDQTVALVGSLLATLAPTLAAVAVLVQVKSVQSTQAEQGERIERVASDTYALTNGLLDSKVRAGVAEVIRDDLLDPEHAQTVATDKRVRDEFADDLADEADEAGR